jgi:hypothetical protein
MNANGNHAREHCPQYRPNVAADDDAAILDSSELRG